MFRSRLLVSPLLLVFFVIPVTGETLQVTPQQFQFCYDTHPDSLYCLLPTFGLTSKPNQLLGARFAVVTQRTLALTNLIGVETATLTIPSPATGVSFTFDRKLGVMTRSLESFGPILSDRAETLGGHKLAVGFTYEHFGFDSLNGSSLIHNVDPGNGLIRSIDLELDEFTTFITWGVTQRIDVSAVFPVRTVKMAVRNSLGLQFDPDLFLASLTDPTISPFVQMPAPDESKSRTGLSDITLRFKSTLWKAEHGGVGFGVDVRAPVGDPLDFLGAGAWGVKPFVVGSLGFKFGHVHLHPHLSTGFEWNGSSILGGSLLGVSGRLPRRWLYSVGTEVGLVKRATVSLDLIGERLFSANPTFSTPFDNIVGLTVGTISAIGPTSVDITRRSVNLKDVSIGGKVNPWGNVLLTGNLSWRLDRSGLRARLVPLVGISYTF